MLLFLDIDGVLRRKEAPLYRFEKPLLDRLENMLRSTNGLDIVISSDWKDAFSLDSIRLMFSADIAPRIIGVTPSLPPESEYCRYREIRSYLSANGLDNSIWAVIDDNRAHFPDKGIPNIFYTDPALGIQDTDIEKIRVFFCKEF